MGSDNSFGPQHGTAFDFTLLFNDVVLTIIPATFLIAVCPVALYSKRNVEPQVDPSPAFWAKLILAFILLVVQSVQLGFWGSLKTASSEYSWGIAAGCLSCLAALCIGLLSYSEHQKSIQPSTVLSVYFGITVFLDGAKARSYLLRSGIEVIGALHVVVSVAKFALLVLEERPKTPHIKDESLRKSLGQEALSGFWSRSLFLWLNRLFVTGFRRNITVDDLGNLGPGFSTEALSNKFHVLWGNTDKTGRFALVNTLLRLHVADILYVVPHRVLFAICTYAQPFLVYHAVTVVEKKNISATDKYGLVIATLLVYGGIGIFRATYTHQNNRIAVLMNGTLLGAIYTKVLQIPVAEAAKGAALTHISADLEGVTKGVTVIHNLWMSFVEIGFLTYFLYIYISYSCFLLFVAAILSTLWAMYFGPRSGAAQGVWNEKIEDRVGQTTHILAQAKQIKLLGLQGILLEYVQGLRITEIKYSRRFRVIESVVVSMIMLAACFTPVLVIAGALYWTDIPLPLQAGRIFATLTVVTLATYPMYIILHAFPIMHATLSCADRVKDYLLTDDWVDSRNTTQPQIAHISEKPNKVISEKDGMTSSALPFDRSITLIDVSLTPASSSQSVLDGVSLQLPSSLLTMIVGPSGSGKSIFLKALAGEAEIRSGSLTINRESLAYCDQKPWLCNGTIRENIVRDRDYDETWYQTVVRAFCLEQDFDGLPHGDETVVGTDGSKLSGGQRHRVAAARAVYPRTQIVIFDDFLSALDASTGGKIMCNLFNEDGLLRKLETTAILATHSLQFVEAADTVLEFGERGVQQRAGSGNRHLDVNAIQHAAEKENESIQPEQSANTEAEKKLAALTKKPDGLHRGDASLYMFFLKTFPVWMFLIFLFFSVANTVAERDSAIFMRYWISHHPNTKRLFPAYAILGFAPTLTYLGLNIIFHQFIVPCYAENMHRMLVQAMLRSTISYLTSADLGFLVNRISQDMTVVTQQFVEYAFRIPYSFMSVVADIALIASSSSYATLLIPVICLNFYLIQLVYLRTSRQIRLLDLEAKTPLYSQLAEIASGIEHIRAFRWQRQYIAKSFTIIDQSQKPYYYMKCIQRWLALVIDGNNLFVAVILILFAIYWREKTSESGIGLAYIGLIGLCDNFAFFIDMWVGIETTLGSVARVRSFMNDTPQEEDDPNPATLSPNWPSTGQIAFNNVSAKYMTESGPRTVLQNMSFEVPGGAKAGFVGRTGSGKSSLFLTLVGGLPYEGSITIDGIELRRIPLHTLRQKITPIPQEGLTLPGSIRQNLMPWLLNSTNPADDPNQCDASIVAQALRDTFLTEKIASVGGLDESMKNFGLSVGERQLFSMARSILMSSFFKGKIILMDEVSSNIDTSTDTLLQLSLDRMFQDHTVGVIAHRTDTVKNADVVFELENGIVSVERGLGAIAAVAKEEDQGQVDDVDEKMSHKGTDVVSQDLGN